MESDLTDTDFLPTSEATPNRQVGGNETNQGNVNLMPFSEPRKTSTTSLRRSVHPFLCRLGESAHFSVNSPLALVSAGFASLWMGFFTLFRLTPLILYSLIMRTKNVRKFSKIVVTILLFGWQGIIMFVLLFLGMLLTISKKVTKRWVLMLHPWGLLLLYVDIAVWIFIGLSLHFNSTALEDPVRFNSDVQFPLLYFIFVYVDCACFGVLHYIYATYFIAAELTIIERYFY